MQIPHPRIETVRRSRPGNLLVGDYAVTSATMALVDFIEDLASRALEDTDQYSLRYSVPAQLCGTSCDALLAPTRTSANEGWAAYRLDANWSRLPGRGETIHARAEAEYVTNAIARFSLLTTVGGARCVSGRAYYVRVRDGVNLATGSPIESPGPQFTTHDFPPAPEVLRLNYSPFLVKLLMNPAPGSSEPLGRRLHPLGSVPLGAAACQALRLLSADRVASATMRYLSTMSTETGFETTAILGQRDEVQCRFLDTSDSVFATCSVWAT